MKLPEARQDGSLTLERALRERRSIRTYAPAPLSLEEVGQLLWAAQGITGPEAARTTPSAGALYPLELYLVAAAVLGLPAGLYHYAPRAHELENLSTGDLREALCAAAFDQDWMKNAPAAVLIAAAQGRTTRKYRERGKRYVAMEAGHAAQNLALQAVALGLGSCVVAAFDDARLREIFALPPGTEPFALLPVGHPPSH
jgi:SagB-type dehydrogenase family enzyme